MEQRTYKRLIAARILSEANDLKRTPEAMASELGLDSEWLRDALRGDCETDELYALIDRMAEVYPIDGSDLRLIRDDCIGGAKLMRALESEASSRIVRRIDKDSSLTPYYEYRDTACSRLSPFRPEWIRPLRLVADAKPDNPSVVFNRGHLLHQYTFYVGPINAYWKTAYSTGGEELNTADSTYGTPFWPHSFATRSEDNSAYILAITFGGDVRRALRELYVLGRRTSAFVVDYRSPRRALIQLLEHHLSAEMLSRAEFLRIYSTRYPQCDAARLFDENAVPSLECLRNVADVLNIELSDLCIPLYTGAEEVVVRRHDPRHTYEWPDTRKPVYRISPMARVSRLPQMKGFFLEVLARSHNLSSQLCSGLHAWAYNCGQSTLSLQWSDGQSDYQDELHPHDSVYIQPFIKYSYANHGEASGALCEARVPGHITLAAQRELSYLSEVDRVFHEDRCWF
jgi:methylphosphonate synthase